MIPVSKTLETDIAVVGGGIGGLCAAIAAAEGGARVMVLEKANTKRSGSGATGNDHFACYYPKHHGGDIRPILRELLDSLVGLCHDPLLSLRFLERSISIVDKWHEWGINMKPFAEDYVFMGHAYPDRPRIWLKYDGHNQKEALTRQAKKVGVTIVNHHPAVDLMRDEQGITGVLALDVSGETPSFTFVKARKVILATGTANRLYPAAGPHRVRSATLLNAGLKYLADLRRNAEAEIAASGAHTLLRAIETLDLIDNGEIVMHGALERKESRGMHQRSDFTFTNPLLADKFLTLRKEQGRIIPEWRQRWTA